MADTKPAMNGTKTSSPAPLTSTANASGAAAVSTPSASQQAPAHLQPPQQQQDQGSKYYTTDAAGPSNSLTDSGTSTRPRDARTIHMVLASLGVTAYQERVPIQLLDFAYRYTNSVLSDAQHLVAEGYFPPTSGSAGSKAAQAAAAKDGEIPLSAIRLATSSRLGYAFSNSLPKETLLQLAADKNKTKLPDVSKEVAFGVRLPHERYIMTGTDWTFTEEWDSDDPEDANENGNSNGNDVKDSPEKRSGSATGATTALAPARRTEDEDEEMIDDNDDVDQDGFEQVFGREPAGAATTANTEKSGNVDNEDRTMENG